MNHMILPSMHDTSASAAACDSCEIPWCGVGDSQTQELACPPDRTPEGDGRIDAAETSSEQAEWIG